jgi:hypothetical protein
VLCYGSAVTRFDIIQWDDLTMMMTIFVLFVNDINLMAGPKSAGLFVAPLVALKVN